MLTLLENILCENRCNKALFVSSGGVQQIAIMLAGGQCTEEGNNIMQNILKQFMNENASG